MSSPLLRWVVASAEPLRELLAAQGLEAALADGRVFVDGRRAEAELRVTVGMVIEVYAPRPSADIALLWRGRDLVAVSKPAALPTEPDKSGTDCVLTQLARELTLTQGELFAVSRLDVGVSGVLLVALGAGARQRLLAQRAQGELRRRYVALAQGVPQPESGRWCEPLGRARGGRRSDSGQERQEAESAYRVVATARPVLPAGPETSLLALSPITGRTHQLRAHAAAHGVPLLGDRRYAGPARMTGADGVVRAFTQVLLHSARVEWKELGERKLVTSEPAAELVEIWQALGGQSAALARALD